MNVTKFLSVLATLSQLYAIPSPHAATNVPSVALPNGDTLLGVEATVNGAPETVNQFLGVPFAAPPERFSPAIEAGRLGVYNASEYGPACIQQFVYPLATHNFMEQFVNNPPYPESEDCLNLNVYAPSTPPDSGSSGYPVMFWIYGGSLQYGTGRDPFYDGTSFAANQQVIVVTSNYRMNVFGFPNSPEIPLNATNLGFLDQRLALQWVQDNIANFGGDPKKVTLFGESAGATSVDNLFTTTPVDPPFWAVIQESGQATINTVSNGTDAWDGLVAALNCSMAASPLKCVRSKDANTIRNITEVDILNFRPVADNITELLYPDAARESHKAADVPVMEGTNYQESRLFDIGETNLTAYLNTTFPNASQLHGDLLAAFPLGDPGLETSFDVISQIDTAFKYLCPASLVTKADLKGGYLVWRYLFNATFPNTQIFNGSGVYHSSEIPLVFGTYPTNATTIQEAALSKFMQTAWASFAKNPTKGPGWPAFGTNGGLDVGSLGANDSSGVTVVRSATLDEICPLFATYYAKYGA